MGQPIESQQESAEFRIEPATERDVPVVLQMIKGLAEYERLSHKVVVTEDGLREALFGARAAAEVVIAWAENEAAGFAVFFPTFSTFQGKPGLYLEDLYVEARFRRRGLGRRLLAHVAALAVARGCSRLTWAVLDWNEPAFDFYRSLGAEPVQEWVGYGLAGEPFSRLAGEGGGMRDEG